MATSDTEIVIVGGGAAGIAAARRLHDAAVPCLLVEARRRLGGRAWTVVDKSGFALDLGCGWLHSADRNPWVPIAQAQGRTIDRSTPPWGRPASTIGFPLAEQRTYIADQRAFFARLDAAAEKEPDGPASALLDPHGRWNNLIGAVTTYISGVEPDRLSVHDFGRYEDNDVNWRVVEGLGATIAAHAAGVPAVLDCAVRLIDHTGARLAIEATNGTITADRAIITVPSTVLAQDGLMFRPALPEKMHAAQGLPLGLADKLFLALKSAEEFAPDTRLFGRTDRTATAGYHMRPFGRPMIEAYFGGRLAAELETGGEAAFADFAVDELTGVLGSAFARRVKPIGLHRWGMDRFARGSYSYALPGRADCRATLSASVDDRLFFAGEACSPHDFSTAHGALITGVAAAEAVIAARPRAANRRSRS
jgi:monoamine oxidase